MKKIFISIGLLSSSLIAQNYTVDLVKDINPNGNSGISGVTVLNNKIIFAAYNDNVGNEPWVSDGTTVGTFNLIDINPGFTGIYPKSSGPANFIQFGSLVLFTANNPNGIAIYKTDGTITGTALIKQFPLSTSISQFTLHNAKLYYYADDGVNGNELWVTDGTTNGTLMIKDINVGFQSSYPQYLTSHSDGKLYFQADDGINGSEMWVSDGTEAGTNLLVDILPGVQGSYPTNLYSHGGKIYFSGYDQVNGLQLWSCDGSSPGTSLLKVINSSANSFPVNFNTIGNKVIFLADDGANGNELWVTDGTTSGTLILKDIFPGSTGSDVQNLFLKNNKLYFTANNSTLGSELWVTDGTTSSTTLYKDFNIGSLSSNPEIKQFNDSIIYLIGTIGSDREVIKYNYIQNIVTFYDIDNSKSSSPSEIITLNNSLYVVANGTAGIELYKISPTTVIINNITEYNNETINLFPNPAKDEINLKGLNGVNSFKIYDMLGNTIEQGHTEGKIKTSNLSNGYYSVEISGKTYKFIIIN